MALSQGTPRIVPPPGTTGGGQVETAVRPDIVVQIYRHELSGADMCNVAAVKPGYPSDLLLAQVKKLCELVGTPERGLKVGKYKVGTNANLDFTKAEFATNGIIDRDRGILRVGPIVQAFAGAPAPFTVRAVEIVFNAEKAGPNILRKFENAAVRLTATINQNPPVVEYRAELLSQDPAQFQIPDAAPIEQKSEKSASTVQRSGVDWSLLIPLIAAALAASILVYFIMIRLTSKPPR